MLFTGKCKICDRTGAYTFLAVRTELVEGLVANQDSCHDLLSGPLRQKSADNRRSLFYLDSKQQMEKTVHFKVISEFQIDRPEFENSVSPLYLIP